MRLDTDKPKGLYIVMLSIHGLVRSRDMELGSDADTGGQVKYVIELVKALVEREEVERVDLLTRQVVDPRVDDGYAELFEEIAHKGVLVRIPCGPRQYLRKEVLWPYLWQFENNALLHLRRTGRNPDLIHGHYADAGMAGARLAYLLGVPFTFTGHSLGRVKNQRLLDKGMSRERIEKTYNINQRILAEETALEAASMVVASTRQEVEDQYADYTNFNRDSARVIPPGVDLKAYGAPAPDMAWPPMFQEVRRFLNQPEKPMVLALARPDVRKNLTGLIEAYALNEDLRQKANLVIVAGNRDDLSSMDSGPRSELEKILLMIDKYDLYGKVAYPKHHSQEEVALIYQMAAKSGGVFVNPALTEPFGLTLIEAAACGLPIVATNDGGPRDIIKNCKNGVLVDPLDTEALGQAIHSVIADGRQWKDYVQNGLAGTKKHYSWQRHVDDYLKSVKPIITRPTPEAPAARKKNRLASMQRLLISDIDNTLLGDKDAAARLMDRIKETSIKIGFGIATGRHLESAVAVLKEWGIRLPDVLITSVGTEIHSGPNLIRDESWETHINYKWTPDRLRQVVSGVPGLKFQDEENQRRFKISFDTDGTGFPGVENIRKLLKQNGIVANVVFSHNKYVDFLPVRASKGKALKHLAVKWGILMENIMVAGDSGNDREMLAAGSPAVVVGNFSRELTTLKKKERVYFAEKYYADGIMEGMDHFRFLEPPKETL